jgi:hypothetical protein
MFVHYGIISANPGSLPVTVSVGVSFTRIIVNLPFSIAVVIVLFNKGRLLLGDLFLGRRWRYPCLHCLQLASERV